MKRILSLVCVLALAILPAAMAEEESVAPENGIVFPLGETVEVDLDNDGEMEAVLIRYNGEEDAQAIEVLVDNEVLFTAYLDNILNRNLGAFAVDLDEDGQMEILISGDECSADYRTWCLRYEAGKLVALDFARAERADLEEGYEDSGYGLITKIDKNVLTLVGSQDVLGTWMCSREFTFKNGRFELEDGGIFLMDIDSDNRDAWDYGAAVLAKEIEVSFLDGTAGKLEAGEKLLVTATDRLTFAQFITEDGKEGRIAIEPNTEDNWGYKIAGEPDYDIFSYLPYAD